MDAPTRWASLISVVGVLAAVVVVVSVWPPEVEESPGLAPSDAAAALPREPTPAPDDGPAGESGARGSAADTSEQAARPEPTPSGSVAAPDDTDDPAPEPTGAPSEPGELELSLVAEHSGKCLDVFGGSTGDEVEVVQWDCHGGANQRFQFGDAGDGYLTIRASHSEKCLGVRAGSTRDQAPIVQLPCDGAAHQRFRPENVGDGRIRFRLAHSGKCVDVFGVSQDNRGQVIQWECHDNDNQRWQLAR